MNNDKRDFSILLSKIIPRNMIVEKIKENATNFLITKSESDMDELELYCMLLLTSGLKGTAGDFIKQIDEIDNVMKQIEKSKDQ